MSFESPPRCANGCGFFGNAETRNLCSKCYRDFCLKQHQPSSSARVSVEKSKPCTLSPTNSITSSTDTQLQEKQPQELSVSASVAAGVESSPVVKNRCWSCRKKVGLLGFKCRCGSTFCSEHRYPEMHCCTFDYKAVGEDAIAKANPQVKTDKIERF